jgi:TorA maturation chaperone TorD
MTETVTTEGAITPEEMAGMAMERNGLYSLLAAVFRSELTGDILGHLLDPGFQRDLAAVGFSTDALSSLTPGAASLDELSLEFSRLFMGPGKHVAPYESVHLGGEGGSLWGPETSAVKKFIEKSGFAYDEDFHGLPDHISVELEFMAHLTGVEAEAWRRRDPEKTMNSLRFQKEFLARHLGRWVASFSDKVAELAEIPFYPQMASLSQNFVEAESQELNRIDHIKVLAK